MPNDDDDLCDFDEPLDEPNCNTCGGDGVVENVAAASGRWGWDDDEPGACPNCGGSGLRKDQKTF